MREVTPEEFYRYIGPLNVHPKHDTSQGWPYVTHICDYHGGRFGKERGRITRDRRFYIEE